MGYWLSQHLLSTVPWDDVCLVDTPESLGLLSTRRWRFDVPVTLGASASDAGTTAFISRAGALPLDLGSAGLTVLLAVPPSVLPQTCEALLPQLAADASVVTTAHHMQSALGELTARSGTRKVCGIHPLFESTARTLDGQTVYVVPSRQPGHEQSHSWLVDAIVSAGGIVKTGSARSHDETMVVVQTMAHQTLITFADAVASSGLDAQRDVWESRTPLFEALFGLAIRVLDTHQQAAIADIQVSLDGERVAQALTEAAGRLSRAVQARSVEDVAAHIQATRDFFTGSLFDTVRGTATAAVTAAQAKRADLSARRRTGELVGVRPVGRGDTIRVGRILSVSPVDVIIEELLVGIRGHAALLDGPGKQNAIRLGINGKLRRTVFGLGHIDLVAGDALDRELSQWLAHITRDVRFLVPESVAGSGVLAVVADHPGIRASQAVSEVVRTGQRSVVIRVEIRADHDVDEVVEALRSRVSTTYSWPLGLSRPLARHRREVAYLGPPGTFSEAAALQGALSVGVEEPLLTPSDSFDAVLDRAHAGSLAVLPVSSSSSGLVSRSIATLLSRPDEFVAGGVVDVAVRLDAYVSQGRRLEDLRGARIYSHPQALAQCTSFIQRWGLEPVPSDSTSRALELVAGDANGAVALAGADKGTALDLKVAEREVDDLSGSITRFLILATDRGFGDFVGGSDPTVRSIWVSESVDHILPALDRTTPAFDELLTDADNRCLWVTSRVVQTPLPAGAKYLGRAPWSPRTPVVRVDFTPTTNSRQN